LASEKIQLIQTWLWIKRVQIRDAEAVVLSAASKLT